jgi:hypothetical protein
VSRRQNWNLRRNVLQELTILFPDNISIIRLRGRGSRYVVDSDKQVQVSVYLCRRFLTQSGEPRWKLHASANERDNIALLCFVDANTEHVVSYHLVPPIGRTTWKEKVLRDDDSWLATGVRLEHLSRFYENIKAVSNLARA